ncbi:MAG TPA: polysaccharide deacetylase family protein [Candidatus Limnocylindrales bacterium]
MSDGLRVALTVDVEFPDRPTGPGATVAILDALEAADVRATMFIQGRWAEAEPVVARRIAADGHLVGNHSHHHARLTMLTGAGVTRDVRAADAAITAATGVSPRPWFRCPFGAGAGTLRVVRRLADAGYVDVGWHVDPNDWAGVSAPVLRRRVADGVRAQGDGAVVLLHGWPDATPIALPGIIADMRASGATFVTVDELDTVPGRRL